MADLASRSYLQIREALLTHVETALIDVREEADFAEAHPLFAANMPLSTPRTGSLCTNSTPRYADYRL